MKRFLLLLTTVLAFTGWAAAEEVVAYTCSFANLSETADKKISSYTSSWTNTCDGNTWKIENFNNNNKDWTYIKCGNKTAASTAYITSEFAAPEAITKVVVTIDAITASSVNSIKLNISTSEDFTSAKSIEVPKSKGAQTITIAEPNGNCYYQLAFSCKKGSSNGLVTVSKVEYYTEADGPQPQAPSLAWSEASCTQYLGATELEEYPTLTNDEGFEVSYTSSNPEVATISTEGEVTIVGKGTTTIAAATEATEEYNAGNATYTLRVVEPSIATGGYNLLTNLDELDGAQGIIVSDILPNETDDKHWAFDGFNDPKSNTKGTGVEVSIENGVVFESTGAAIINFAKVAGGYTLQFGDKYLYAINGKTDFSSQAEAATATITIENDGHNFIKFNNDGRAILWQGASVKAFRNYATSQLTGTSNYRNINIYIYKEGSNAPVASHTVTDVEDQPGMVKVELSCDNQNARIYYLHTPAAGAYAAPANGYTRYTEPLIVPQGSTINYYAEHKGIKSDEVTVSATTGVEGIVVDGGNAEAEYFDLHGRRVANPSNGVYVRRIGTTTTKIVL